MLDRYAKQYEKIGDVLGRALPPDWTKSWTQVEMDQQQGLVVVYYVGDAPAISWIKPPLALYDRFRELNNAARLANATWTTATFILARDGAFSVDFGYDPIPLEEEELRSQAWKARYLP